MTIIDTPKLRDFLKALMTMSPSHREAVTDFAIAILTQKKCNEDFIRMLEKDIEAMKGEDKETFEETVYEDEEETDGEN